MASKINFKTSRTLRNVYQEFESNGGEVIKRSILKLEYEYKSWCSDISKHFKISKVDKIINPYLEGMYLLYKEEFKKDFSFVHVKEMTMYHATSSDNAITIASQNIDWRKTRRARFGKGANFSPCPAYAHKYSSSEGVCKVLLKSVQPITVNYNLEIPGMEYDTVSGNDEKVYVKFDDFTFYPEYIVHYKRCWDLLDNLSR